MNSPTPKKKEEGGREGRREGGREREMRSEKNVN